MFKRIMLMNEAGDGSNGGGGAPGQVEGGAQGESQPNEIEKLKNDFQEALKQIESLKNHNKTILDEAKALKKEKQERQSKSLEDQGDFKTLWENERTRAKELETTLQSIKEEEQSNQAKLLLDAKMEEAFKALGGRDKLHNPEDIKRGLLEKIVVDPTTGKFDSAGIEQFANDFRTRFGYTIKPSDASVPGAAGQPIVKTDGNLTQAELAALPYEKRRELARAKATSGKE